MASFESLKRIYIRKDRLDAGVHIQGGKKKKRPSRGGEKIDIKNITTTIVYIYTIIGELIHFGPLYI